MTRFPRRGPIWIPFEVVAALGGALLAIPLYVVFGLGGPPVEWMYEVGVIGVALVLPLATVFGLAYFL